MRSTDMLDRTLDLPLVGPHSRTSNSANLDVLRSTAVLLVLFEHVMYALMVYAPLPETILKYILPMGRLGVILFFFHTSLVLMMSMKRISGARRSVFVLEFYIRRAFRIYPLAIFCVLAVYFFRIPVDGWENPVFVPIGAYRLWSNLLLVMNLSGAESVLAPLWSLPYEVEMYFLLPFLFLFTGANWKKRMALLFAGAVGAATAIHLLTGKMNLLAFVPCFLSGILAFRLSDRRRRAPAWAWPLMLASLIALYVSAVIFDKAYKNVLEWGICFALAFLWRGTEDVTRTIVTVPAEWIARYSYGIYLSHTIALWLCFCVLPLPGIAIQTVTALALTAVLSVTAYHLLENPFIQFGKRQAYRLVPRQMHAASLR